MVVSGLGFISSCHTTRFIRTYHHISRNVSKIDFVVATKILSFQFHCGRVFWDYLSATVMTWVSEPCAILGWSFPKRIIIATEFRELFRIECHDRRVTPILSLHQLYCRDRALAFASSVVNCRDR